MHISEVLSPPVLLSGAALAAAGVGIGLKRLDYERLMGTAMFTAVFFAGTLVHVPIGVGNAHLILNGLLGMLLGWAAFPAIFTALLLQAMLFQYGGLTTLGVNTVIMAAPAVLCSYLFSPLLLKSPAQRRVAAFACGALSVAGAGLLAALALTFSEDGFWLSARLLFAAHIPIMLVEGVITAMAVGFMAKVRPEVFGLRATGEV